MGEGNISDSLLLWGISYNIFAVHYRLLVFVNYLQTYKRRWISWEWVAAQYKIIFFLKGTDHLNDIVGLTYLWHSNSAAIYYINIALEFVSNAKREQSWDEKSLHFYVVSKRLLVCVFAKLYVPSFFYTNRRLFVWNITFSMLINRFRTLIKQYYIMILHSFY